MKWATLALGLCIGVVIVAADLGYAGPLLDAVQRVPYGDKICHTLLAGLFCLMLTLSVAKARWVVLPIVVVLLAVATIEEFSQQLFPSRTFSRSDLVANYVGVMVGGTIALFMPYSASSSTT